MPLATPERAFVNVLLPCFRVFAAASPAAAAGTGTELPLNYGNLFCPKVRSSSGSKTRQPMCPTMASGGIIVVIASGRSLKGRLAPYPRPKTCARTLSGHFKWVCVCVSVRFSQSPVMKYCLPCCYPLVDAATLCLSLPLTPRQRLDLCGRTR